ncbi:MAG: RDD family protein, partial [Chitinophagales bacterium]
MTHKYQTASISRRFIAYLIDVLLVGMAVSAFLFVTMGHAPEDAFVDEGKPSLADEYPFFAYADGIVNGPSRASYVESFIKFYSMEALIGLLLIPMIYFVFFEGLWGASIGKLITGIRVRRKDGGKINFGVAFIRYLGRIISTIIFLLGYALALIDSKRQTLHDKIANT